MLYPTRLAVLLIVLGLPVTLAVAIAVPDRWYAALALPLAVVVAALADALSGAGPRAVTANLVLPPQASVGATVEAALGVTITGAAPRRVAFALDDDPLLAPATASGPDSGDAAPDNGGWLALDGGRGTAAIPLVAHRRGTARIERLWLRWSGPLGLIWKQRVLTIGATMAIHPDTRPVRARGAELFRRRTIEGLMAQIERGDGADFDTLVEFRAGMDRRTIDWKQSARHVKLHAKEYRTERNNQLVFAVDCGRQMREPIGGLSRLDRVVSAMLLTGWVALKVGDRVALNAFDSRPRVASGLISGTAAFGELQRLAARIDYSGDETNYTLALTTLATRLVRRSMIVLFTEFTDLTSADFMVRAAQRLMDTHLVLVVVLEDVELETILDRGPQSAADVTRAVTAAALLRDRRMVLLRLRHLGAHIVESPYDQVADRLVEAYVDLKRRNLL